MGIENGMGYSDYTPLKQKIFGQIVRKHLEISACIFKKNRHWISPYYWYIDTNAGRGESPDGGDGSPLLFLREAAKFPIKVKALFIELREANCSALRSRIASEFGKFPSSRAQIQHGDHSQVLSEHFCGDPSQYGLLYVDPSGNMPPFDLLARFSKHYRKMDIVINTPCATVKRVSRAFGTEQLPDYLSKIRKDYWVIREPFGAHQWSFLIGTNWDSFPDFKHLGFHPLFTEERKGFTETGWGIFKLLSFTRGELNALGSTKGN